MNDKSSPPAEKKNIYKFYPSYSFAPPLFVPFAPPFTLAHYSQSGIFLWLWMFFLDCFRVLSSVLSVCKPHLVLISLFSFRNVHLINKPFCCRIFAPVFRFTRREADVLNKSLHLYLLYFQYFKTKTTMYLLQLAGFSALL